MHTARTLSYSYFPGGLFSLKWRRYDPSPKTNKAILDAGLRSALDETCLPVKLFFGHVLELAGSVDQIVPLLIGVEPGAYICPKFMGLPDCFGRTQSLPPRSTWT